MSILSTYLELFWVAGTIKEASMEISIILV